MAILDSPPSYPYNRPDPQGAPGGLGAQVAQLVEHCTENAGVGGSIPPLGTRIYSFFDTNRLTVLLMTISIAGVVMTLVSELLPPLVVVGRASRGRDRHS